MNFDYKYWIFTIHICVLTFQVPANSQNLDNCHGCEFQKLPPGHSCHAIKEVFQSANYLKCFTCSHYTCSIRILLKCREQHLISSYLNLTIGLWSWRTCFAYIFWIRKNANQKFAIRIRMFLGSPVKVQIPWCVKCLYRTLILRVSCVLKMTLLCVYSVWKSSQSSYKIRLQSPIHPHFGSDPKVVMLLLYMS